MGLWNTSVTGYSYALPTAPSVFTLCLEHPVSTSEMGPAVGQPQRGGAPGCIRRPGLSLRAGTGATGSHELCLAQVRGVA